MTFVSQGFTREEIREMVHQYHLQPYGTKKTWLARQSMTERTFRRWRKLVLRVISTGICFHESMGVWPVRMASCPRLKKRGPKRSLNTSPKSNSLRAVSVSLRARIQRWEKLSGSCTS